MTPAEAIDTLRDLDPLRAKKYERAHAFVLQQLEQNPERAEELLSDVKKVQEGERGPKRGG